MLNTLSNPEITLGYLERASKLRITRQYLSEKTLWGIVLYCPDCEPVYDTFTDPYQARFIGAWLRNHHWNSVYDKISDVVTWTPEILDAPSSEGTHPSDAAG